MINYLIIRLKNKILGFKNILVILLIIFLVSTLTYFYSFLEKNVIYNVAIIDNDLSITSKEFISELSKRDEIDIFEIKDEKLAFKLLKQGKFDILYTINSNFEENLKNGDFDEIISYNKESTMKITSWLNDYIGLKVLKKWTYFDIYNLINKNLDNRYSFKNYDKLYKKNYKDNSIIELKMEFLGEDTSNKNDNIKIFTLIFGVIIMYISMFFGKEVIKERDKKIIERLSISEISLIKYLIVKILVLLIYLSIGILFSYIILINLGVLDINGIVGNLVNFKIFILINFLIILLFIKIFNNKNKFMLITQGYILISILTSSNIFKGSFPLVNHIRIFFPLSYLIDIV